MQFVGKNGLFQSSNAKPYSFGFVRNRPSIVLYLNNNYIINPRTMVILRSDLSCRTPKA